MSFGQFNVLAGHFAEGNGSQWLRGYLLMRKEGKITREKIHPSEILSLDVASEENTKGFFGSAGMGLVGGLAFGGIGVLAGVMTGGNKKIVTVTCEFKDGRKFLANMESSILNEIQATLMNQSIGKQDKTYVGTLAWYKKLLGQR